MCQRYLSSYFLFCKSVFSGPLPLFKLYATDPLRKNGNIAPPPNARFALRPHGAQFGGLARVARPLLCQCATAWCSGNRQNTRLACSERHTRFIISYRKIVAQINSKIIVAVFSGLLIINHHSGKCGNFRHLVYYILVFSKFRKFC